ncbi:MAG: hypothetical protein K9G57_15100 [Ignavibacteriales bacterium]|nr:hypothetical protein [Ignavibacteriales bacterium]MCF8438178.1 hypothetical protein [Ignavibacteriales bacterium]
MRIIFTIIFFTLALSLNSFAQSGENWVAVDSIQGDKLFIDVSGLKKQTPPDIFVWTKQYHSLPLVIESVKDKIHQTKTYYILNKKNGRYSILEVIYYDEDGNVLKSFSYKNEVDDGTYKYNYPIMTNTDVYYIYKMLGKYLKENQSEE